MIAGPNPVPAANPCALLTIEARPLIVNILKHIRLTDAAALKYIC